MSDFYLALLALNIYNDPLSSRNHPRDGQVSAEKYLRSLPLSPFDPFDFHKSEVFCRSFSYRNSV